MTPVWILLIATVLICSHFVSCEPGEALPRPPTNVRISDITATSVRLSWSYDIGSENIIYYVIQYKPKQANQEYSEISGITTMFYTVRDLSPYTEYEFYVIAFNGIGRGSPSTPVVATTGETVRRVPPYFSIRPENLYEVMPGSSLNITCVAVGSPMPFVKWRKGLTDITPDHTIPIGRNVLVLTDISESNNYTCIAASKLGNIETTAQVFVQALPRPPTNVRISDVTATSVRLSWSYDIGSENIIYYVIQYKPKQANQEYSEKSGITTMFYTVRDLSPYTEYEFYVIAVNGIGRGSPSTPVVATTGETVRRVPPYFSIRPENLYEVMPGSSLNITCVAVGSPMPFVKWRKGLMDITPDHTIRIGRNVLVLTDISESNNYTCIAASKLGNIETTAQVFVQALPRPPTNVRISDVTATSVRLSWSYDIGSENIIYYVIQYKPKQANQEYSEKSGITTMFYTVRDLSPYTEYEFYVIAVNGIGRGSRSTPVVATTGETVRRVPPYFSIRPENLYEVMPGSSLNITCVAVGSPMPFVKWRKGLTDITPDHTIPIGRNVLVLTDISESNNYTCIAASKLGNIETTAQVFVQALPRPPTNVRISDVTATSVRLSWSYDIGSENIIYYVIQYKPKQANQEYSEISGITTMFYTVRDLSPYTEYEFYVIAFNGIGRGSPSTPVVATTGETVRRVPPYFSIRPENLYEVMPGSSLNITCVAVGSPMPFVKWRKGLMYITPDHTIPIGRNVLVLTEISESNNYTCIAASKLGNIETTAQVFVQGHALASQSANLYMDSAISAVQYALQNEELEPTRLSEYTYIYKDKDNGVDGTVKYFEGSLSGLSKVERYSDCDGPRTISGTTAIDCTLVFDRLKASHKGKFSYGLHEANINVTGNIHSIYIKVGIVKSISERNPRVKSLYFIKYGSMDTYFTGLGPLYNQTKVLQDIYETVFKTEAIISIQSGFRRALNVTVASLPMPVD